MWNDMQAISAVCSPSPASKEGKLTEIMVAIIFSVRIFFSICFLGPSNASKSLCNRVFGYFFAQRLRQNEGVFRQNKLGEGDFGRKGLTKYLPGIFSTILLFYTPSPTQRSNIQCKSTQ